MSMFTQCATALCLSSVSDSGERIWLSILISIGLLQSVNYMLTNNVLVQQSDPLCSLRPGWGVGGGITYLQGIKFNW